MVPEELPSDNFWLWFVGKKIIHFFSCSVLVWSQLWWYTHVIPALRRRVRQKNCQEFKAGLVYILSFRQSYIASFSLKKKKRKEKVKEKKTWNTLLVLAMYFQCFCWLLKALSHQSQVSVREILMLQRALKRENLTNFPHESAQSLKTRGCLLFESFVEKRKQRVESALPSVRKITRIV